MIKTTYTIRGKARVAIRVQAENVEEARALALNLRDHPDLWVMEELESTHHQLRATKGNQ